MRGHQADCRQSGWSPPELENPKALTSTNPRGKSCRDTGMAPRGLWLDIRRFGTSNDRDPAKEVSWTLIPPNLMSTAGRFPPTHKKSQDSPGEPTHQKDGVGMGTRTREAPGGGVKARGDKLLPRASTPPQLKI